MRAEKRAALGGPRRVAPSVGAIASIRVVGSVRVITSLGAIAAVAVFAACGSRDSSRPGEATDGAAPSADTDPPGGDSAAFRSAPESEPAVPLLVGEGPPRDYRLLLVNASDTEVRVFARAAASRVALDTVPPRDSTRIDIRVRADEVRLDAEDPNGAVLLSQVLALRPDSLNRWVISREPPSPAADSSPGSLVRPDTAGYPRTQPTSFTRRR